MNFFLGLRVGVTPLAGVWIEIKKERTYIAILNASLPLRECGLKLEESFKIAISMSLPLRECGLK